MTDAFIFGILSNPEHLDTNGLKEILKEGCSEEEKEVVEKKFILKKGIQVAKGKEKINKPQAVQINYAGKVKEVRVIDFLKNSKFEVLK